MRKELTDFVKKNWVMVIPVAGGIYGTIEASSGLYEIIKTGTNAGIVDAVKGVCILGTSGISAPLLYKLSEYFHRNKYQEQQIK